MGQKSEYKRLNFQRLAIRFIPYQLGMRLMYIVFSWPWVQKKWFKTKWRLFSKLGAICPMDDTRTEFKVFLSRSYFRVWLVGAFSKLSDTEFDKIVKIEGLDVLQKYLNSDRGVLLLSSNVGFGRLLAGVLARKGISFLSLDGGGLMNAAGVGGGQNIKLLGKGSNFLLRQLFDADKALKKGGMVHSTGDGSEGSHSLERSFLNYNRKFQTSLLELAVKRDALVMPVFVTLEGVDCIQVKFYDPLGGEEPPYTDSVVYSEASEKVWPYGR